MAAKKTVKKAVAKKAPAKKVIVKKAPAKKAVAKKAPASAKATAGQRVKKVAKKKAVKKTVVNKEQFYSMVTEAAYFAAQNDGNKKSSTDYWMEAEAGISSKFSIK